MMVYTGPLGRITPGGAPIYDAPADLTDDDLAWLNAELALASISGRFERKPAPTPLLLDDSLSDKVWR